MNHAYLSIGSNTGDRKLNVQRAIELLSSNHIDVLDDTDIYETPCCHGHGPDYLNTVIHVGCERNLSEVTSLTKQIERQMGRTPQDKGTGIVPIDIDVVIWNSQIVRPTDYDHEYFKKGYRILNHDIG